MSMFCGRELNGKDLIISIGELRGKKNEIKGTCPRTI